MFTRLWVGIGSARPRSCSVCGVPTLRRWEREGTLTVERTPGGQRLIPEGEVARLLAERRLGEAGPRAHEPAQRVRRCRHEGHEGQGVCADRDPGRPTPRGLTDHAGGGRRAPPQARHGGGRHRQGDQRDDRGARPMRRMAAVLARTHARDDSLFLLAACCRHDDAHGVRRLAAVQRLREDRARVRAGQSRGARRLCLPTHRPSSPTRSRAGTRSTCSHPPAPRRWIPSRRRPECGTGATSQPASSSSSRLLTTPPTCGHWTPSRNRGSRW